jgi:hypothetical protein
MVSLSPNSIKERFFHQSLVLNLVGYPPVLRCKSIKQGYVDFEHPLPHDCWLLYIRVNSTLKHFNYWHRIFRMNWG